MALVDVIAGIFPDAVARPNMGFIELGASSNTLITAAQATSVNLSRYVSPIMFLECVNL